MSYASALLSRNSSQTSYSRGYNAQPSTPFCAPAVNSNPNFRPSRICMASTDNAATKAPKAPEKPLMPYMRYSRRMWERVRASHPELKFWEIGKIIGKMWRELTDREKQIFCDEYELEKVEYDKMMTTYHNSAAFQNYLAQKNREKNDSLPPIYLDSQPNVFVQPLDEETDDAEWNNVRHCAMDRYSRNHKVMSEILSNTAVPDLRSVVTTERVNVLRSQVTSLTVHQEVLENEYRQLIEKYDKRKRRMEQSKEWFEKRMKQIVDEKPKMTDDLFEEMTENWKKKYTEAYEKIKRANEAPNEQRPPRQCQQPTEAPSNNEQTDDVEAEEKSAEDESAETNKDS